MLKCGVKLVAVRTVAMVQFPNFRFAVPNLLFSTSLELFNLHIFNTSYLPVFYRPSRFLYELLTRVHAG